MRAASPERGWTSAGGKATISNLIVPLDGSTLSRVAIPLVCRLMELYGATPHLLHAGAPVEPRTTLARLGVEWQQLPGGVIHQTTSSPAESILHLANELPQSLIVMCTHTGGNRRSDCFGSITEAVLAGNPDRIVLLAPEYHRETFKLDRIVLGHDGTPKAAVTVGPAAELAYHSHGDVIAVHVAAPRRGTTLESGSLPAPQYVDQPQHEWPSWTTEFTARLLALGMPASSVKFKVMVAGGQPGSELARFARSVTADMVVLANKGDWEHCRNNIARVVIRSSGCPVMLVSCGVAK